MGSNRTDRTIDLVDDIEVLRSYMECSPITDSALFASKCIFRVPEIHRRRNATAYDPNQFSIGPLHHGKSGLEYGETIKKHYLSELISRLQPSNVNIFNDIVEEIKGLEEDARNCYAVPFEHSVNKFIAILVLDGCFIIELFRKVAKSRDTNDPIVNVSYMLRSLQHDLFLLENQIPWSVLVGLYSITSIPTTTTVGHDVIINDLTAPDEALTEMAIEFCHKIFPREIFPTLAEMSSLTGKHLLDLLRNALVLNPGGSSNQRDFDGSSQLNLSATDLQGAGIEIKKSSSGSIMDVNFKESSSGGILGVNFSNGVLHVPALLINETGADIVRNLISFEQCYRNCPTKITSYAIFLDNLLNTTSDMDILRQNGIIGPWFKSQEEIKFFNKLYADTYVKDFYYKVQCEQLDKHCQGIWPRCRLIYMSYFTNPWAIGSQIAGGFAMILTIVQTVLNFLRAIKK